MSELPRRRSARLAGYDYGQCGAYFVTVCSHERRCIFGKVVNDAMVPNALGRFVEETWKGLAGNDVGVETDEFVVMPNHVHGIIVLTLEAGAMNRAPTLGEVVRGFKARVTHAARAQGLVSGAVWQRGYHEHIIRDEADLLRLRTYIDDNPLQWAIDSENPACVTARRA